MSISTVMAKVWSRFTNDSAIQQVDDTNSRSGWDSAPEAPQPMGDAKGFLTAFEQYLGHSATPPPPLSPSLAPAYAPLTESATLILPDPSQSAPSSGATTMSAAAAATVTSPVVTTLSDGSTMVGSSGQLQFHLIWDSSVASAPAGFKAAAVAAASEFTEMYSNAEVVNIDIGYGEVHGSAITSDISDSIRPGGFTNYSTLLADLNKDAGNSTIQAQADASLPSTDPLNARTRLGRFAAGGYYVTYAEMKALGMMSATGAEVDGYIGLSSTQPYSYTQPVSSGQYDAIGTFEFELGAVMGRIDSFGSEYGTGVYTPLDLFNYASPGVWNIHGTAEDPYFSIDGGNTALAPFDASGADPGCWASSIVGDSFGYARQGVTDSVSPVDLAELSTLGYNLTSAGLAAAQKLTPLA